MSGTRSGCAGRRGCPDDELARCPMSSAATELLARAVLARLTSRGETLATAESLTGGLIGELLTDVPGASVSYLGGVIAYATRLKATLAGVPDALLATDGPVAQSTARAMAFGIAARCGSDWGLAVTGVAGPDSQDGHRPGEVYVALVRPAREVIILERHELAGDRAAIRQQTAEIALQLLADALE
jgi:nicotinamide-nucleotide amidase